MCVRIGGTRLIYNVLHSVYSTRDFHYLFICCQTRKIKEWWQMNHKLQNFFTLSKHNHYQPNQLGLYRSGKKQNVEYGKNYNTLKNRKYRQD